jgi:predicted O-methyltransferase YrrM
VSVDDLDGLATPAVLAALVADTTRAGFTMASEPRTGALLRTLAAAKPGGRCLELGTGTGIGTAWILDGMDDRATLDTVDTDAAVVAIARRHLDHDHRVTFHLEDGATFLARTPPGSIDLLYADAWPGKFTDLDQALATIAPGGIYAIDDLLPQPNWPDGHARKVDALLADLVARRDFAVARLAWASGLAILVRRS